MHVALIRQHFDRHRGGAEYYAVRLAHGLRDRGHQVTVVCARANANDSDGIEIVKVPKGKLSGAKRHLAFAKNSSAAAHKSGAEVVVGLARALPCDVLRLGDPPHHALIKLKYGPLGAATAAKDSKNRTLLDLESELMAPTGAPVIVANSEFIKRQMMGIHGIASERIRVLRNPVNTERFNPKREAEGDLLRAELGIGEDEMVVLFSGMGFERKGLNQSAQAFAKLISSSAEVAQKMRFLVVGKGDASPAKSILAKVGAENRMISSGPVDDIERYYAAANVFVLPTIYDPAANAVGEALACGTPVVTTRMNGASELIRPGDNGMVIDNREDSDRLAAAISRMLATERIQRSRQFVAMVRPAVTIEEHIDAWEEILSERIREKVRTKLKSTKRPDPSYSKQVIAGRVVLKNESSIAEGILKRVELSIPVGCFEPRRERLVRRADGEELGRYPVRGARQQRDRLFALDHPAHVFLKVDQESPESALEAFQAAMNAETAGVKLSLPLAAGSDGRRSFFLYAEVIGEPLPAFVEKRILSQEPRMRLLLASVMQAIAKNLADLHFEGICHGGLKADSIAICLEATGEVRASFSAMENAHTFIDIPLEARAEDLASLHRSIPIAMLRTTDRLRFLRAYIQVSRSKLERRALISAIRASILESERIEAQAAKAEALAGTPKDRGLVAATVKDIDTKGATP